MDEIKRCGWCGTDSLYVDYHDAEWGVPVREDRTQFEFLILEGAQAGLSWITILKRRDSYREAFMDFDPAKVARFGERDIQRLLKNSGIIRNRAKIKSAVANARAFLKVQDDFGNFSSYIWSFIDGRPIQNTWKKLEDIPPKTEKSEKLSRDLKARGFEFVGPTIVYAHMQATGMVNDHLIHCFRHNEVASM